MLLRALASLLAATLIGLGLVGLAGGLYQDISQSGRLGSDLKLSAAAALQAEALGHSPAALLRARLASLDGDAPAMRANYLRALRDAPARGYLWADYAQALAWAGQFGADFDTAVQRARALSPRSASVALALAELRWRFGPELSPTQQKALDPDLLVVLKDYAARQPLLERVVSERRHEALCAEFGQWIDAGHWCSNIGSRLNACNQAEKLEPVEREWCHRVDAVPPA